MHLLEARKHHAQQLDHDGSRDVRHDTEREDGGLGEGASREHVEKLHQTVGSEILQCQQLVGIDTRQDHVAPEAVDDHKQQRDADSLAEILYAPDIFNCFCKSHCVSSVIFLQQNRLRP